ncbi:hypothetical protein [Parageobacillus sp. VR-IP]|uniref:hypothetical protein n=1 Tax=Parageobacillus sp. VR-IP TaxID=2742205 RepID=UPI0020C7E891|nr:hypothetical protein [Parageobacillus sp. VR-IP]
MFQPNYTNPTWREYIDLLNWESRLVQEIEIHSRRRDWRKVIDLKREKQKVAIRRKCLKAALQQKEKPAQ